MNDAGQAAITVFAGEPYFPAIWSPSDVTILPPFPDLGECAPVIDCSASGSAINNRGQLVGTFSYQPINTNWPYYQAAYLWTNNAWTLVKSPSYGRYNPYPQNVDFKSLNAQGQVVATYGHLAEVHDDPYDIHLFSDGSFLWDNGSAYKIIDPNGASPRSTVVDALNDLGEIIGYYTDTHNVQHGFVDRAGVFTTLDFPGAHSTELQLVNNSGEIVGSYVDIAGVTHYFLYEGGEFQLLALNGPDSITSVTAINNNGEVVGNTLDGSFIYKNGAYQTIDMNVVSLNDQGDILTFNPTSFSGAIGYPVTASSPEPGTLGLLASAALCCALLTLRHHWRASLAMSHR